MQSVTLAVLTESVVKRRVLWLKKKSHFTTRWRLRRALIARQKIQGLFLGNFPLENALGFRIGGIISHGFLRPYAVTFDFENMLCYLVQGR